MGIISLVTQVVFLGTRSTGGTGSVWRHSLWQVGRLRAILQGRRGISTAEARNGVCSGPGSRWFLASARAGPQFSVVCSTGFWLRILAVSSWLFHPSRFYNWAPVFCGSGLLGGITGTAARLRANCPSRPNVGRAEKRVAALRCS